MHGLTFEMKRAHVAAYRFAFDELRGHAVRGNEELFNRMTPARFDILFVLHESARAGMPRVRQSAIWRRLGLHRSTISKAVSAMVDVGYVLRDYLEGGVRRPFVVLTEKGRRAIAMALHVAFSRHALRSKIENFYVRRSVERGEKARLRRRDAMKGALSGLARLGRAFCSHFGRQADIVYPIDPESEL